MNCVSACLTCNSSKGDNEGEKLDKWLINTKNGKQITQYIKKYKDWLVIDKHMLVLGQTVEEIRADCLKEIEEKLIEYEDKHKRDRRLIISEEVCYSIKSIESIPEDLKKRADEQIEWLVNNKNSADLDEIESRTSRLRDDIQKSMGDATIIRC